MRFLFEHIILTYPGGTFLILYGFYNLKKTLNQQRKHYSYIKVSAVVNGIIFSTGCVVFGFLIIFYIITNKF